MDCPSCRAAIQENSRFCGNCGLNLASNEAQAFTGDQPSERSITCRNCGTANYADDFACIECGEPLHRDDDEPGGIAGLGGSAGRVGGVGLGLGAAGAAGAGVLGSGGAGAAPGLAGPAGFSSPAPPAGIGEAPLGGAHGAGGSAPPPTPDPISGAHGAANAPPGGFEQAGAVAPSPPAPPGGLEQVGSAPLSPPGGLEQVGAAPLGPPPPPPPPPPPAPPPGPPAGVEQAAVPPDGGLGGQLPGIEQGFPGPQGIPGAEGFQPPAFPGAEQAAGLGPPPIDPFSAAAGSSSAVPGGAAAGAGAATHGGIGIIKVIVIAVAATGGVALGGAIVGGILIFTGDPQACSNREIDISRAVSNDVDAAWNAFVVEASQEGSASITLTEDEVTSRGFFYLEDEGVPFDDLQLYFCDDGAAEAKGRLSLPGPDANVVVRGSLDISGDKPRIEIEEVRAGNLPGGIATPAVNAIIDSGVLELDLDIELTDVDFREGEIELEGEG